MTTAEQAGEPRRRRADATLPAGSLPTLQRNALRKIFDRPEFSPAEVAELGYRRLQQADGSQSLWQVRGDQFQRMPEAAGTPPVPFNALELPDALYLRRTLVLPRLTDEELASAVALDVASASPFPAGDLVWAHGVRFDDAEKAHANIVLASRRQIDTWLIEGGHAARPGPTPELWAVAGLSSPIVVPGHGAPTTPAVFSAASSTSSVCGSSMTTPRRRCGWARSAASR